METLRIIAAAPIRIGTTEVAGEETLAIVQTDHKLSTLLIMLQQKQARIEREGNRDEVLDNANTNADPNSDDFAERLKKAKASTKTISLLMEAGVTSTVKAQLYLSEHNNTFEPIEGIGEKISASLVKAFAQ